MTSAAAPMKTQLSRFCRDYSKLLLPLRQELGEGIDFIRNQRGSDDIKEILSKLCDVHHRMKNLADKIDSQQAYVIIFGPLKSGKSTLMNAFSGAYVSEVTALPAYPCLVHVRHGEEVSLKASHFNGQTERFEDFAHMKSAVEVYHHELAERIREVEEQEEDFDPGIHCPNAIRRLDIALPAEPLKESYTILVDTPGLYSRMKFGYDLMTREFRDSAACAVFVVKTDNLFLEQVFEEFSDLLNLFSRIFLVVNIDGHKCDLEPDGELRPSLESREPQKIIDAFCSLSMSAPLRHAYEEGRLRLYPIDLLKAASERLGGRESQAISDVARDASNGADNCDEGAHENNSGEVLHPLSSQQAAEGVRTDDEEETSPATAGDAGSEKFHEFMADLTNYLNSNDYILHFMRDSLRQGRQLIQEIEQACGDEKLDSFMTATKAFQADYDRGIAQRKVLEGLKDFDWGGAFTGVEGRIKGKCEGFARSEQERVETELEQKVDEWFASVESLKHLLDERINPAFDQLHEIFRDFVMESIREFSHTDSAGAELSDEVSGELDEAELSMADIRDQALDAARNAGEGVSPPDHSMAPEAMPVRRRFWDWLLLRSRRKIRTKFLGDDCGKDIPVKTKEKRLGEKSKKSFCDNLDQQLEKVLSHFSQHILDGMVNAYTATSKGAVCDALDRRVEELNQRLPRLKSRIESRQRVCETIRKLADNIETHDRKLASLEDIFSRQHPESGVEDEGETAVR